MPPLNNQNERLALAELGLFVDAYTNNADALAALERGQYQLVISDIARRAGQESGLDLLKRIRGINPKMPFLFYVTKVEGSDVPGAQGITNDPVELVTLVRRELDQRSAR